MFEVYLNKRLRKKQILKQNTTRKDHFEIKFKQQKNNKKKKELKI